MSIRTKITITILVVAIIFSAAALGYFKYFSNYSNHKIAGNPTVKTEIPQSVTAPTGSSTKSKPSIKSGTTLLPNFKLYKNSEFGFQIQYPVFWTVTEEINENVRGEMVKEFFFKKPNSDLRFAILPRDGLSYGVSAKGTSTPVYIGGFPGMQTQYILKDGRRLWVLFPQTGLLNWLQDLGRIDAMTSAEDPIGDSRIFEQMLNSFKLAR